MPISKMKARCLTWLEHYACYGSMHYARAQVRRAMSTLSCPSRCAAGRSAARTETAPLRLVTELPPPGVPRQARSWGCQAATSRAPEWRLHSAAVHSAAMADAVESIRQERGEGVASSQALADDAVIWASQHGLVPPVAWQLVCYSVATGICFYCLNASACLFTWCAVSSVSRCSSESILSQPICQ